jgi:predicted metal-binding membrane protein
MKAYGGALIGQVARHERSLPVVLLLLVIALCWAYLLAGAGTMEQMDGMLMPMSAGPWTMTHALVMLCMWIVMMAAMMLPSAMPMILLYGAIARRQAAPGLFAAAYLVVWSAFGLAAVVLQYAMERAALLSPMMESTNVLLTGALLIAAGSYQFTTLKSACLTHCQSPLDFVVAHWRTGSAGAFRMGARHGIYCVGCCWMLMLLLFAGGVMNLAWIAGLALYVLVEKLVHAGRWISRTAGALLVVWGLATCISALLAK